MFSNAIIITERKLTIEEEAEARHEWKDPIMDGEGNTVGYIIYEKHGMPRIVLNEDCPKYIVELFTIPAAQKRTPEVTIRK